MADKEIQRQNRNHRCYPLERVLRRLPRQPLEIDMDRAPLANSLSRPQ